MSGNICLAMMVKNEEKTILKSLNSCKPVISSVKIYDTGSTDKTLDVIEQFKHDNPNIDVQVILGEFVDFATSRNVLLDFVDLDQDVQFALLLDANDELQGHDDFVKFVQSEKDKTLENTQYYCSGYLLRQSWYSGGSVDTYFNVRFIRVRHEWRYKSPVHEYISSPKEGGISIRVENPNIILYQDRTRDCESSFKRFSRDKDILLREHLKNPNDARTCFYLAQTYGSLGMQNEAYYYYKLRLDLGGYEEEIYHSYQRLGEITSNLKMDSSISIGWWMKALEHTRRSEPALKIANHYLYNNVKHYLAAAYTTMAIQMDYPVYCNLFVNKLDYEYTRYHLDGIAQYYVGGYQQGLESCKKAIEYNEAMLKPILENVKNLTNQFIQTLMKRVPKLSVYVLECIHLANSGNVQYIYNLCSPPKTIPKKDDENNTIEDANNIESSPYYSSEHIENAKLGKLKSIIQYTNEVLKKLHTSITEEKDQDKIKELTNKRVEIFKYNDKLMNIGIRSLQSILQMKQIECTILTNLVMQVTQKNMYEMKLEVDKNNNKFYIDKLAITKEKKDTESASVLKDDIVSQAIKSVESSRTKKNAKGKKGKSKKK